MKILVVDNDKNILEIIKKAILSKTAYDVDAADNGEMAMEVMKSNGPPDLLIVDIMMPGISGLDLCEQMAEREGLKNIPVILISSLPISSIAFQEALTRAHNLKVAKDILEKPFEIDVLITKINNIITRKALIIERPKTKTAWLAMGFGLGAILGGPVLAGRLSGGNISATIWISFEIITLILSVTSLIVSIRAFGKNERSWVLLVGFVSAILVIVFWIFMTVLGLLPY